MNFPLVSIVIPAFNAQKNIKSVIEGALSQTYSPIELIIVDDGSNDETARIAKGFERVKYIFQENSGPAAARNRGVEESTADFVFFTDSDCIPRKDWIRTAFHHFKNERVAVVSGSYGIANSHSLLARCIQKEILYRHRHLMPQNPKSFGSYNFGIRKKIFEALGGFNTSYLNASGEDNDLSYRIVNSGSLIQFEINARVNHHHPEKLMKYLKEQYRHGYWRVKLYGDHPEMAQGDDYTFWKDICEIPIAGLIVLLFVSCFFYSNSCIFLSGCAAILILLELFYGLWITKSVFDGIYFSWAMFLRSFFRFFGFTSGILHKFIKKIG